MDRAERAQMAMMLEVCAYPKPGNVDRCHDYSDTRLEHFLASTILARPAFDAAERTGGRVGSLIREAVTLTAGHAGGNTHFGAFILLIPLVLGGDIDGARRIVSGTDVEDAIDFYAAFGLTSVRMPESDDLDVNDPASIAAIRERGMTLADIMAHSAPRDMVAREWTNGFALTRRCADLLHAHGHGRQAIVAAFLDLLASEPDTFIAKKHGEAVAERTMRCAAEVLGGGRDLCAFDAECIAGGINPGSIADITIAGIYVALGEGWQWDC
ncbi:MAG: Triphosphoribosyl-dephospho-CoA protein [Methanoculleus marisnigri]|jgi:Triphosphoribosyl-dephospho-CoA synthetase|uniref:Triphosphoribosyl-dephospho-CoA protein n=1 Tax=Methanoculleus marisnigri TaxID=2198 RepID=A0A101J298_9EURY|nr:triphosphoribosyl-dephospho-CoA synthase [Methanoculleus marisnigri]KUK63751.1 MAG: Triphosphoribosyl-dephospho-CoA protein [Methanoculleus marisnigri]KUL05589.1 MAG: Triphosphoribosyl-dephospho-CoA protein [Methanoculleus marisnigri]